MNPPDDFEDVFANEGGPTWSYGEPPMTARITTGLHSRSLLMMRCLRSASREEAYTALQAHYADLYGSEVTITVEHLCSSPEDREEGTWRHSAKVEAKCEHGLSMRICTVDVVTQREERP